MPQQRVELKWFRQECLDPQIGRSKGVRRSSDDDDWYPGRLYTRAPCKQELLASHAWHVEVEDDEMRSRATELLEGAEAVFGTLDGIPLIFQGQRQKGAGGDIVVHNKNCLALRRTHASVEWSSRHHVSPLARRDPTPRTPDPSFMFHAFGCPIVRGVASVRSARRCAALRAAWGRN